jgi:predicted transposase/invertase (TIGR01784 family)
MNVKITRGSGQFFMYDNTCKYLAENFPEDISSWLLGVRVSLIQMQPTELSVEPIRADSMILLTNQNLILHVEFQTVPDREMGFRMLDYRVRGHRKFPDKQMRQVVIYLTPTTSDLVSLTTFELEFTRHEFEVIRLWEQPASIFLESVGLYPFATLAQTDEPELVLQEVAAKIEEIPERKLQADISAMSYILAGLVLDRDRVGRIIRRDIMRESVTYQEILAEGEVKGKTQGRVEGRVEEARALIIRLLTRKLGSIEPNLLTKIEALPLEQVESLGEDLLDFTSIDNLDRWLNQN